MDEEAVSSRDKRSTWKNHGTALKGQSSGLHLLGFPLATEWVSWSGCDVIPVGALEEVISFQWLGK